MGVGLTRGLGAGPGHSRGGAGTPKAETSAGRPAAWVEALNSKTIMKPELALSQIPFPQQLILRQQRIEENKKRGGWF